jgi:hypothetical protein
MCNLQADKKIYGIFVLKDLANKIYNQIYTTSTILSFNYELCNTNKAIS